MAVQFDPGGEFQGESPQLISAGGNIYSIAPGQVKRGTKTLGRGHWAGASHADDSNPDVDHPSPYGASTFVPPSEEEDEAFSDDTPPEEAMIRTGFGDNILRHDLKQARQMVEAASGAPMIVGKSVLTLRSVKVDLLLQDPDKLTEEQLIKSASTVKFLIESTTVDYEKNLLANYASRIVDALRSTLKAREEVAKAILTKPSEEREKKPKKMKPKKASETSVNDKGKVAYKYEKRGDGKGPNSDRGKGSVGAPKEQEQSQQPEPTVAPPPPVDSKPFAEAIGIGTTQLERFAAKKDRKTFVSFFMSQKDLVDKHKITPAYLGRLWDSITTPPEPQQGAQQGGQLMKPPTPQPAPGPNPAMPGAKPMGTGRHQVTPLAAKSVVVFTGATLNADTLAMIDMLKSSNTETVSDIAKCLQTHYACTEEEAFRHTVSFLNRWERKGLVSLYPAKL